MCSLARLRSRPREQPHRFTGSGFTLVEMLVSIVILIAILLLVSQMIGQTSSIWSRGSSKMSQFRESRTAFDALVNRLQEATVDSYCGYQFTAGGVPQTYYRRSELRFLSGPSSTAVTQIASSPTDAVFFTAPLGKVADTTNYGNLPSLLNVCGYYIQWSNADVDRPPILLGSDIYRFRLMQFIQPSEYMSVYFQTIPSAPPGGSGNFPAFGPVTTNPAWQLAAMQSVPTGQIWARPVANNVVALLLLPALSTTDTSGTLGYTYNSETFTSATDVNDPQNRLPPVIRIVLYTIDEASAKKLGSSPAMPSLYSFGGTSLFTDATKLYPTANGSDIGDLGRFESTLTQAKLTFRRFETAVQLARSPWKTLLP